MKCRPLAELRGSPQFFGKCLRICRFGVKLYHVAQNNEEIPHFAESAKDNMGLTNSELCSKQSCVLRDTF